MCEKNEVKDLKEQLFVAKNNGALRVSEAELAVADDFCEGYKIFLNEAKTEHESVEAALKMATEAGFEEFDRKKPYKAGDKVFYNNRGKSLVLAVLGEKGTREGLAISVAHVDSPRLDLKPQPLYEANDLALCKTHYYGGIKKYQWLALPLALHGKFVKKSGEILPVKLGEEPGEPRFCVTDLLPHLSKEQMQKPMAKGVAGEDLNVLVGSRPFRADSGAELVKLNIMRLLNEKYGVTEDDFISAELELVPAFDATDIGLDSSMVGAYGQDDRVCAYAILRAILDCKGTPERTVVGILADKEEVGSDGNTGMNSDFFEFFVEDLAEKDGVAKRHVLSQSQCFSADVNAAFDPTYATAYDPLNSCYIGRGAVVTKYTGSGGKYSTSDASAEFMAGVRSLLDEEKVLWQTGELGKVDAGGGGTIAKYMASLNVDVVDVGVPVLSMHSPLEVVAKLDVHMVYRAIAAFFTKKI